MKNVFKKNSKMILSDVKSLLKFEFLYKVIMAMVVAPTLIWILNLAVKVSGLGYITNTNILEFLTNPLSIIIIILILFLMAFYTLVEMGFLAIYFSGTYFNKKYRTSQMFRTGLSRATKVLKPRNILFVFFLIFIIPITNIALTSGVISTIKIPEFILDFIKNNTLLSAIFFLVMITLNILALNWIFAIHYFVLEDKKFVDSIRSSKNLIKGKYFKTLFYLIIWNIAQVALISIVYTVFMGLILGFTWMFQGSSWALSLFLSAFSFANIGLAFIISAMAIPLNFALISNLFFAYKEEKQENKNLLINLEPPLEISKKKKYGGLVLILIILVAYNGISVSSIIFGDSLDRVEILIPTQVVAHRGDSVSAPENTIAAIDAAIVNLADYAEIDVQETKDGVIVVLHDSNLKRLASVDKNIWELTYDEVRELDVGSWFSPEFAGEKIPTLDELIKYSKGKIKLNIELKPSGREKALEQSVIDIINENNFKSQCFIASLDYNAISKVKEIDPSIKTAYVLAVAYGNELLEVDNVDAFSIESSFITKSMVENLHKKGKEIYAWTVNTEENMKKMVELNVDHLITDNTVLARQIVFENDLNPQLAKVLNIIFNN